MKNKIELRKVVFKLIIVSFIAILIFSVFQFIQYRFYIKNFNNKVGSILSEVIEQNPNVKESEIIGIVNSKDNVDLNLLEKYGIDINKDSIILNNDRYFAFFTVVEILLLIFFILLLFIIFLKYNYKKDKNLKQITKYIEEINKRNYKLDIDDNTEDELSILKNEIYKTTVMLKEVAENSQRDKINLKDSLSDISHQLKTPLTSITIMIDNILDTPDMDEETKSEFLKDIKKQITNTNFLINSLLKLSRFDADSVIFINKEENLQNVLNQAINNVAILCDLKNIKINVEGDIGIKIFCDEKWQVEAITNILKNGVEHSNENSKIDIKFEKNKLYTKIDIQDYGIGIEEKDIKNIFKRFYKGKNSSSESIGIGLALAKVIIEKNNGNITVNSKINYGTTFTIKYFN